VCESGDGERNGNTFALGHSLTNRPRYVGRSKTKSRTIIED